MQGNGQEKNYSKEIQPLCTAVRHGLAPHAKIPNIDKGTSCKDWGYYCRVFFSVSALDLVKDKIRGEKRQQTIEGIETKHK